MCLPQIKAGVTLINVKTKERLHIDRVDLRGAYLNGNKTPVFLLDLTNKVRDRILVKA